MLRQILSTEAPEQFVFMDVACGTATASAKALKGTGIGRYIGIDISQPSLDMAREALADLNCPVDLRCKDFVEDRSSADAALGHVLRMTAGRAIAGRTCSFAPGNSCSSSARRYPLNGMSTATAT
jgi:SAM-dependent methyltransferase